MTNDDSWAAERDFFLQSSPPRRVPPSILKVAASSRNLGCSLVFCFFFICFGSVFTWLFAPAHLMQEWKLDKGPTQTVEGRIISSEQTRASQNKERVYQYTFTYPSSSNQALQGTAYTTGLKWSEGERVSVKYLESDPTVARPAGGRMDSFGKGALFVLVFPLIGILLICLTIYLHKSRRNVLHNGLVSMAKVTEMKKTLWTQQKNGTHTPVYKVTLLHMDNHETLSKNITNPIEIEYLTEKFNTQEPVTILYLPHKQKQFLLPDTWKQ